MKHLSYILVGFVCASALAFLVGSWATHRYADHWAKSDDDINLSVWVFVGLWPVLGAVGAGLGHRLYKRKLAGAARGPARD